MEIYREVRKLLQNWGKIDLEDRSVYPYLRFLQQEFGAENIFLVDPDLFILGHEFPKEIVSRSFRYIQFATPEVIHPPEMRGVSRHMARKPVVLLDPSIYIPPTFPQLFLVEDEQFQDWDVKIDGKKYALRKPKADQGFLIDIISSYLIPDLARLVLQYLPLKEELIGSLRGFVTPTSVAVSKRSGNIYVLSPGAQIIVIHDSKGKVIGEIETRYLLKYPQRIAISPTTNHIYVTDASRIYVFDDERSFLRAWGSRGVNAGEFKDPQGMTISDDGEVYVADRKNNRIQVFDEKGTFLRQWGSDALKYPSDVAVSGDEVYVVDTGNHQVKVYSRDGKLLRKWGETGWEEEQFMGPLGIAISPTSGEVYVTDEETSSFQVFAKDGKFLRREIRYDASFNHLEGIAIDSKGEIYIANRGNNNVLIFRVSLGLVKEEEEED